MNTAERITLEDWTERLDMYLLVALGRASVSFQGVWFEKLFQVGCTPGDVVEALVDVIREVEGEDGQQAEYLN